MKRIRSALVATLFVAAAIGTMEWQGNAWGGQVRLWDAATRKETAVLKGHADEVLAVAFSPDGKTLATGSKDQTVKLWDVATGKETATLRGHESTVAAVAFSPDGKTLATAGGHDKTVRLWDAAAGEGAHAEA